jgi:hypothetical protein
VGEHGPAAYVCGADDRLRLVLLQGGLAAAPVQGLCCCADDAASTAAVGHLQIFSQRLAGGRSRSRGAAEKRAATLGQQPIEPTANSSPAGRAQQGQAMQGCPVDGGGRAGDERARSSTASSASIMQLRECSYGFRQHIAHPAS